MSYISPFNDMQNLDEHNHDFINQNIYKISKGVVADEDYVVSYEPDAEQKFVPLNSVNDYHEKVEKEKKTVSVPEKPVTVKNDVYIHWDPLTHFYFASLTVISLFVMFRSMQKSH